MATRLDWIDQARGLSIFLVVYGHNFPINEPYIYSFHVPLFFFIAGMFHPKIVNKEVVIRRAKMILIPYFIWATLLYLFWFFAGRNFGTSATVDLSPVKNFIGIFYAQGGQEYMDWGIPLWFIPCIFLVFIIYAAVNMVKHSFWRYTLLLLIAIGGFLWPYFTEISLPWSLDVACVALGFYSLGGILKKPLVELGKSRTAALMITMLAIHIASFYFNTSKADMYRSIYGDQMLFFISGLTGSLGYILLFKLVPVFKFLSYLGRHTIVLLATHSRMLTVIKFVIFITIGTTVFEFSETEKLLLSVVQIFMVIPIIWIVNKYAPILDGKIKRT